MATTSPFGTPTALNNLTASLNTPSNGSGGGAPSPFAGIQSSTPATTPQQLTRPTFSFANLGFGNGATPGIITPLGSQSYNPSTPSGNNVSAVPSSTGGLSFNPQSLPQNQNKSSAGLASLLSSSKNTGSGTVTTDGNGNVTGYTPNSYTIDTSNINSDALGSGTTMGDVTNKQQTYAGLVNALSQAQGYSSDYIAAQSNVYGAQAAGAQMGVQQAANAFQAYGANQANNGAGMNQGNLGGATTDYVNGAIGGEQSQLAMRQAENTQQQTSANIALNAQQLARTGNIAAAQTQLSSSPTGMSGQQAITQYQQLQQQYPNAGIPPFDPSQDPVAQYNAAMKIVGNSAAYQSGFQSTYTTPGGGTGIYSKLDVANGALQSDGQGGYQLVSGAAAALGQGNADIINNNLAKLSDVNKAIQSSTSTLSTTQAFMNQNGLGSASLPILQQIQNNIKDQTTQHAAITAFNNDLTSLRADYAQYLVAAGGGSIAGTGPDSPEVVSAIPNDISLSGIQQVVSQMQQVGTNNANALNSQITQGIAGLQSNSVQSTATGGTGTPSVSQMNF